MLVGITLAELRYGADLRKSRRLHGIIDAFVSAVQVMPLDASAGYRFGTLAATLVRRATRIGEFDALIAAHALAENLTSVTDNTKHFARVPGLRIENWVGKRDV